MYVIPSPATSLFEAKKVNALDVIGLFQEATRFDHARGQNRLKINKQIYHEDCGLFFRAENAT